MRRTLSAQQLVDLLRMGDDTALPHLYDAFAESLKNTFIKEFTDFNNDQSELEDIITDSLIELAKHPERYNPAKSSLKTFVYTDIKGNILNKLASAKRKKCLKIVELTTETRNIKQEEVAEVDTEVFRINIERHLEQTFSHKTDQRLAWMIVVEKVRETKKYAEVLDIQGADPRHQEITVKRTKDRITAKLKRSGFYDLLRKLRKNV